MTPEQIRQQFQERALPEPPATEDMDPVQKMKALQKRPGGFRDQQRAFWQWASDLVDTVFGTDLAEEPRPFRSWSETQRAVLEELANIPAANQLNAGDFGRKLERVGAMTLGGSDEDDRYLRRYVGQREPTALEREVDERPLWLWLRLTLMDRVDASAFANVCISLSAEERVDLAARALDNTYFLLRPYPCPSNVTDDVERQCLNALVEPLSAMLSGATSQELLIACDRSLLKRPDIAPLLGLSMAKRGEDLPTSLDEGIGEALTYTTMADLASKVAPRLPEDRLESLVRGVDVAWFNANGWDALKLLKPMAAASHLQEVLSGFDNKCKPTAAAAVAEVVASLDEEGRAKLASFANSDSINASIVADALAKTESDA